MKPFFNIPSDVDDTSCFAIMVTLLESMKVSYPLTAPLVRPLESYDWSTYYQVLLRYTYRPFDNATDPENAKIATRSYLWIHDFLGEVMAEEEHEEFRVSFTWFQFANESEVDAMEAKDSRK